jgi:hypothetical protein
MRNETRFRTVEQQNPQRFGDLLALARQEVASRFAMYEHLARPHQTAPATPPARPTAATPAVKEAKG